MSHGNGYGAINLETEEDIRKWREERKKNYPTKEKIAAKKALMAQQSKRGQTIKSKKFDVREKRNDLFKIGKNIPILSVSINVQYDPFDSAIVYKIIHS